MRTLTALLALCEGNPVDSPHKGPIMQNFDVYVCCKHEHAVEQTAEFDNDW